MTSTAKNPSGTPVANPLYPTTGSSFGALKYNLNEMLSWALGDPTQQELYLYSNLANCISGSIYTYYIFTKSPSEPLFTQNDTYADDPTLAKLVSQFFVWKGTIQNSTFTSKEYATQFAKKDGLFGFAWFPWNVYGLPSADISGSYNVRSYSIPLDNVWDDYIQANPLCKGSMYIKMFTILKLLGIGIGAYALVKLSIKLAEHESKK